jgi:hypothetical protein
MKKYFLILVFMFSNQLFALDNVEYDDIQSMRKAMAPHIVTFCRNGKTDFRKCLKFTSLRFQKSFQITQVDNGSKFLKICYSKQIAEASEILGQPQIKSYFDCIKIFNRGLNKKTAIPEFNHYFLIDTEIQDMVYLQCKSKFFFRADKTNECMQDNGDASKKFLHTFMTKGKGTIEFLNIKKCTPLYKKEVNGKVYFEFNKIMKCIKKFEFR